MEQPNLNYIEELAGDDISIKRKLIKIIKEEFPKEKESCINAIEKNDFNEAAALVHKIKHKISILGLEKSYKKANGFEQNLKEKSKKGAEEFQEILSLIISYLKTI